MGAEVIFTPPGLFCMEIRDWNTVNTVHDTIIGGAWNRRHRAWRQIDQQRYITRASLARLPAAARVVLDVVDAPALRSDAGVRAAAALAAPAPARL